MGQSKCAHLIAGGYYLTVFNRTPSTARPLLDTDARLAPSPATLAAASDVFFSIVGFPSNVDAVLLGPAGVTPTFPPAPSPYMTTSDPSPGGEISAAAASRGCSAVDAPVSGGDRLARAAALTIFAGYYPGVVGRLAP